MKILDVGAGVKGQSVAAVIFKEVDDLEVVRMDIDPQHEPDLLQDITQPFPEELYEAFDIVVASHVLEHIDRDMVIVAIKNMARAVRVGGELWIMVPSMEWAARQIRQGNNNPVVQAIVFGGQHAEYDYHRAGFTLLDLRQLMDIIGFATRKAYQAPLGIGIEGKTYDAIQDIIIGYKYQREEQDAVPEHKTT